MEWINLHQSTLSTPEYLRSDPSERGTWLNLLAYCCQQENGGFIADCLDWKDRTWQQIAGVTRREVLADCRLWQWNGTGLRLFAYPVDKELELKAERAAGRVGGLTKQKNKLLASIPQEDLPTLLPTLEGMPLPAQVATLQATLLRKGREGKGREGKSTTTTTAASPVLDRGCTLPEALAYAAHYNAGEGLSAGRQISEEVVRLWHDERLSTAWVTVKSGLEMPIADWQANLRTFAHRYAQNEHQPRLGTQGGPRVKAPVSLSTAAKNGF